MQKRIFAIFTICLGLLTACEQADMTTLFNPDDVTFYATNGDIAATKTILQADGTIQWLPKEEINVFYGNTGSAKFVSDNTEQAGTVAFKGALTDFSYREGTAFWAVYPYRESHVFTGDAMTVSLPSQQIALAGSFADDLFVSIARTTDFTLQFYNVCGGIKFCVTEAGVKTVTFQGNGNEPVAGSAKVGFNSEGKPEIIEVTEPVTTITLTPPDGSHFEKGAWYYIAVWPTALENGYKITLTKEDGTSTIKRNDSPVTVKRAIWGVLENLDKGLVYQLRVPDNEIWYTTTDGKPISLSAEAMEARDILSHDYVGGQGRIVFKETANAEYLVFHESDNLLSVRLPESVTDIGPACFFEKTTLETIEMPGVKIIHGTAFQCSGLSGRLLLPEGLVEIQDCAFSRCPNLTEVVIPESLQRTGCYLFDETPLKKLVLKPLIPPESNVPRDYFHSNDGRGLDVTYESLLENNGAVLVETLWHSGGLIYVPEESLSAYQASDVWKEVIQFITVEGKLPSDCFYSSTDYSRDGEVVTLQKATVGYGVNLVFLGDGYVDRDLVPGGKYEQRLQDELENFFAYEPYKTLRNRFNVYQINVVSKNDVYRSPYAVRTFTKDLDWNAMDCYDSICEQYARKANVSKEDPLFMVVLRNKFNTGEADFCESDFRDPGYVAFAYCSDRSNTGDKSTLPHEMGGHGIGRLADEYVGIGLHYEDGPEVLDIMLENNEWGPNVDYNNEPGKVRWSRFLSNPLYSGEGLGVYEGGMVREYDIYRCSENSVMNGFGKYHTSPYWITSYWFNAPSREAIYKQVMRISEGPEWKYDYETFVNFDAAGREQAAKAYQEWKAATDDYWSTHTE